MITLVEATETFVASLALDATTPLTGYAKDLTDTGIGTITDNDTATFSIDDVQVNEVGRHADLYRCPSPAPSIRRPW